MSIIGKSDPVSFNQLCIGSPLLKQFCNFIPVSNHGYSTDFRKLSEQPKCAPPWIGEKIHVVLAILPQAITSLNSLVYIRLDTSLYTLYYILKVTNYLNLWYFHVFP